MPFFYGIKSIDFTSKNTGIVTHHLIAEKWDMKEGRLSSVNVPTLGNTSSLDVGSDFSSVMYFNTVTSEINYYKDGKIIYSKPQPEWMIPYSNGENVKQGPVSIRLFNEDKLATIALLNGDVKVWDVLKGEVIKSIQGFDQVNNIEVSSNGNLLLIGGMFDNNTKEMVKVFDIPTLSKVKEMNSNYISNFMGKSEWGFSHSLFLSNNDSLLFSTNYGIYVFDWKNEKLLKKIETKNYYSIHAFAVSSDDERVLLINSDGVAKLWNLSSGRELYSFQTDNIPENTREISFSPNGKLAIFNGHGSLVVWDLEKNKKLATMIKFMNEREVKDVKDIKTEWIVITPEGYFSGSDNAAQYLSITKTTEKGMTPFDIRQLYDHFFRPDLVKLKLAGEDISQYTDGVTYENALKNPPPEVHFKLINNEKVIQEGFEYKPVSVSKDKLTLSFDVQEKDQGGVGLIRIYQEGKLVETRGGGEINKKSANMDTVMAQEKLDAAQKEKQEVALAANVQTSKGGGIKENMLSPAPVKTVQNKPGIYNIELALKSGTNEISIEAFNKTNTVSSFRENIVVNADIPETKPKLYAIVAGVNEFESPNVENLQYSQNDAEAIKQAAESKMKTVFDEVEVIPLLGKDVTKEKIIKAANTISKKAKLGDTVLFYISTHGRAAMGELYLVPYNNKDIDNWINFGEIFASVQSIKALNQVFVIDACESGQANDIVSSVYDSRASVLARSAGVHMFLATTKGTKAFEHSDPTIKNGVFTHRILQALDDKTVDLNDDNYISVLELSEKLKASNDEDYQRPIIRSVGNDVFIEKIRTGWF
jgi:WD40 repeat protein